VACFDVASSMSEHPGWKSQVARDESELIGCAQPGKQVSIGARRSRSNEVSISGAS